MERLSKKEIENLSLDQKKKYYNDLKNYYANLKDNKLRTQTTPSS